MSSERLNSSISVVIPVYNEEKLIRSCLESLYNQNIGIDFSTVIVDNGSTDSTRQKITEFSSDHEDFPIKVIEEPNKGTGIAAHTGFDYAINHLGSRNIARTDADCIVSPNWLNAGSRLLSQPKIKLATGPVRPRDDDEFYKPYDKYTWPVLCLIGRFSYAVINKDSASFGHAAGGNTFIESGVYENIGGYQQTSIEESCEDAALSRAVKLEYGLGSMGWSRDIAVSTSMRRRRSLGVAGLAKCYILRPDDIATRLAANNGNVDIR